MNRKQQKKIKPSVSFSLFLDAFSRSVLTDDKKTMPTYDPDDAVRAGGVIKRHHFQDAAVNFSILSADTSSARSFQILQKYTNTVQKQSF